MIMKGLTKIKTKKQQMQINFIHARFMDIPERLLTALGIRAARTSGFCCPVCESGRGSKGTGMSYFQPSSERLKLKCFACDKCFDAFDLVRTVHPEMSFPETQRYLVELYTPEHDPINDRELSYATCPRFEIHGRELLVDDKLMETYNKSILYRQQCPTWQQEVADMLGVPFDALNRMDIGKSFSENDGLDPKCGDLVTFNLLEGKPVALKVRHTPGIGYASSLSSLNYETNTFQLSFYGGSDRTFRQAGHTGKLCFGHDSITDDISTVVIVEGQSDVLAVCAAARECGIGTLTAIGRDSNSHVLKDTDLNVLAGKQIIYCEDADVAGIRYTQENMYQLLHYSENVRVWKSDNPQYKDARSLYNAFGASHLISNLLSSK